MKLWNQKDKRWSKLKIGKTKLNLGDYGCYIVSLSMIKGLEPNLTLNILNEEKCFNEDGELLNDHAAKALDLEYLGISYKRPDKPTIAQTDHFKKDGFPKHFFIDLLDGFIFDPLDGTKKQLKYNIVNWRQFYKKESATPLQDKKAIPDDVVVAMKEQSQYPIEGIILCLMNWLKKLVSLFQKK